MVSRLIFTLGFATLAITSVRAETTFDDVPRPPSSFAPAFQSRTNPKVTYSSTVRQPTVSQQATMSQQAKEAKQAVAARPRVQPVRHARPPEVQYGPYAQIGGEASSNSEGATHRQSRPRTHSHRADRRHQTSVACDETGSCDHTTVAGQMSCPQCEASDMACDQGDENTWACESCPQCQQVQNGCSCESQGQCPCHGQCQEPCQCQQSKQRGKHQARHAHGNDLMSLGKGGGIYEGATCNQCTQCQGSRHPVHGSLCHSTCDMPQHLPYCSHPNSYYYFRPYQIDHVAIQQDFVRSYGGNPNHPYENSVFDRVYDQVGTEEIMLPMSDEVIIPMPLQEPVEP